MQAHTINYDEILTIEQMNIIIKKYRAQDRIYLIFLFLQQILGLEVIKLLSSSTQLSEHKTYPVHKR